MAGRFSAAHPDRRRGASAGSLLGRMVAVSTAPRGNETTRRLAPSDALGATDQPVPAPVTRSCPCHPQSCVPLPDAVRGNVVAGSRGRDVCGSTAGLAPGAKTGVGCRQHERRARCANGRPHRSPEGTSSTQPGLPLRQVRYVALCHLLRSMRRSARTVQVQGGLGLRWSMPSRVVVRFSTSSAIATRTFAGG